jgi:hypothetical protein
MPRSTATLIAMVLGALPCMPLAAQDGVPRLLIGRDLSEQEVSLVRIESDRIIYRDSLGALRSESPDRYIAVTIVRDDHGQSRTARTREDEEQGRPSILELTDGQRLTGSLVPLAAEAPAEEMVRWSNPLLGLMEFRLDDVRRILLSPAGIPVGAQASAGDVIILANGDRLEGFVGGLGAQLSLELGEQAREIPLDRIAGILFSNPSVPLRGTVLYLRDGSIIACDLAAGDDGQVAILLRGREGEATERPRSESAAVRIPVAEVAAIALDAEALVPLTSLEIVQQAAPNGRRWVPPLRLLGRESPLLGAADVEFPGPMTVEWRLPAGAAYFAARAELPQTMWNWGDCELIVSLVSGSGTREAATEVFRSRMNAETPSAEIGINLLAAARQAGSRGPVRLRVRLDPGLYGPIQDQIVLRRPLLVLEVPPG